LHTRLEKLASLPAYPARAFSKPSAIMKHCSAWRCDANREIRRGGKIVLVAFDLHYLTGYDLRKLPLVERSVRCPTTSEV
jgi:hypothetical protein